MIACADCGKELKGWHARTYHTCPQQLRANRRAQARQREQAAVPVMVPRERCSCGREATDQLDGVLMCGRCYELETQARLDAANDAAK